jgi:hypothetical protein
MPYCSVYKNRIHSVCGHVFSKCFVELLYCAIVYRKKPARLSPNAMGIAIPQSLVELLHIDDERTWVEEIPIKEGLLLRIVNGMPSSEKEN